MMRKIEFPGLRKPYHYDRDAVSNSAVTDTGKVSRTIQSARDEVDINTIVRRFGLTGSMPVARSAPEYGDFRFVGDFQSAMNELRRSQERFDALPAAIRDRFGNDPARFVEFVQDESNAAEARKLGLLRPEPVEAPPKPGSSAPVEADPAS